MTQQGLVAAALREHFEVPSKVDLADLAKRMNLTIVELASDSFDGALVRDSQRGRILVNQAIRERGRKRFTIAHEIGHYILHRDPSNSCVPRVVEGWQEGQPEHERQADVFASELLLPTKDVAGRLCGRWPSMSVVGDIAEHFGTSMTAAARKFCDVASQPCAVVWSTQKTIRWFHGSPTFAHFVPVGETVGFDSFAAKAFAGRELPKEMEDVPAEDWIKSGFLRPDAVVSEQSFYAPNYDGCLSLIWVRRNIEDKPTVEDELLAELDPEQFTIRRKHWR
jgi:Zn-dependent peptidase ImmA (M78 family)